MTWPDGGDNPVTVDIGDGGGRAHATIADWEAATDEDCTAGWGGGIYADSCSPVGECYDDSDFSENVTIAGATTNNTYYRTLTVEANERHAGIIGAGATIISSAAYFPRLNTDKFAVLEWFIIAGAIGQSPNSYYAPDNARHMFRNLLVIVTTGNGAYANNGGTGSESFLWNSFIHGPLEKAIGYITNVANCSVLNGGYAVQGCDCYNVISVGAGNKCFWQCTGDYNIADDKTGPGANSIDDIDAVDLYANIGSGTEDLHLLDDATAASASGVNLSADFTIDIDDDTRVDWDIGADEFIAGGIDYTRGIDDNLGITDSMSYIINFVRSFADGEGLTDAVSSVYSYIRLFADTEGLTDSISPVYGYIRSFVDSMGLSDQMQNVTDFIRSFDDSEGLTDSFSRVATFIKSFDDNEGLTDSFGFVYGIIRSFAESVGLSDQMQNAIGFARSFDDSVGLEDVITRAIGFVRTISDSEGLTDSVNRVADVIRSFDDSEGLTDSFGFVYGIIRSFAESVGLSDQMQNVTDFVKSFDDTINIGDVVARVADFVRAINDDEGLTDSINSVYGYIRSFAESIGLSDQAQSIVDFVKSFDDSVGIEDVATRVADFVRTISDTEGLTDVVSDQLSSEVAASVIFVLLSQQQRTF